MLFNQTKVLKYKDVKAAMKFDDDTCSKNLKSLMLKQFRIIEFTAGKEGGNFLEDDELQINEKFSSSLKRVVFPTPVLEEVYKKGINY